MCSNTNFKKIIFPSPRSIGENFTIPCSFYTIFQLSFYPNFTSISGSTASISFLFADPSHFLLFNASLIRLASILIWLLLTEMILYAAVWSDSTVLRRLTPSLSSTTLLEVLLLVWHGKSSSPEMCFLHQPEVFHLYHYLLRHPGSKVCWQCIHLKHMIAGF